MTGNDITITTAAPGGDARSVVLTVSGDFDAAQVERFNDALAVLPDEVGSVTIDVSGCAVLDSSALGALIDLKHRLDGLDAELITIADKPFQRLILEHTGLAEYLGSTD